MLAVAVMEVTATMVVTTTMVAGIDSSGSNGSDGRMIKIHISDVSSVLCILALYPCISNNGVRENAGHRPSI